MASASSKTSVLTYALALLSHISAAYDCSDQFSSSIVSTHNEDLSLRGHRYGAHGRSNELGYGNGLEQGSGSHRVLHSFIDRDPEYYEEDYDPSSALEDENLEPLGFPSSQLMHKGWESPLETIAPLSSLSLRPQSQSTAAIKSAPSSLKLTCPRHTHEIDVTNGNSNNLQTQQTTTSSKLKTRSTGTTITALLAANNTVLVLAADTRATDGSTVADKRCEKLHRLSQNIWCAGAGTSADVDALVRKVKFVFWKKGILAGEGTGVGNLGCVGNAPRNAVIFNEWTENEEDRIPLASVPAVLHYIRTNLHQSRGALGVNLLVGGYDPVSHRATLAAVHPHGSMDVVTYAALGSGGLAATGVLESKYPVIGCGGCTVEEGIRLAVDAVRAGIDNDLGSGSQVDVCVIGREGVVYRRGVIREEELEWSGNEQAFTPSENICSIDNGLVSSGVNGFGNVPFAIQSKRIVLGSPRTAETEKKTWLDAVIGSSEQNKKQFT
mmetsp:Transcript_11425/g.24271  ORF Transcript_11425/g.24271 Transcript_11425/m.24271 type:complete len:495 (+) Transcript_11425:45-1529(+)